MDGVPCNVISIDTLGWHSYEGYNGSTNSPYTVRQRCHCNTFRGASSMVYTGVGSMGAPGAGAPIKFLTQWSSYTRTLFKFLLSCSLNMCTVVRAPIYWIIFLRHCNWRCWRSLVTTGQAHCYNYYITKPCGIKWSWLWQMYIGWELEILYVEIHREGLTPY